MAAVASDGEPTTLSSKKQAPSAASNIPTSAWIELIEKRSKRNRGRQYQAMQHVFDPNFYIRIPTLPPNLSLDMFDYMSVLGTGGYGCVYRVRYQRTGRQYAMKVQHRRNARARAEGQLLASLQHPFIVGFEGVIKSKENLYFLMELVRGGTLLSLAQRRMFNKAKKKRKPLPEATAKFFLAEIVLALGFMHAKNVVFRDLKPDNVLIAHTGHVRMCDLGLASGTSVDKKKYQQTRSARMHTMIGASGYRAPDMFTDKKNKKASYGPEVDFWNLGLLAYMLLKGKHPFHKTFSMKSIDARVKNHTSIKPIEGVSDDAQDFVMRLLEYDPIARLGGGGRDVYEVKSHPWFHDIDWALLEQGKVDPPPAVLRELDVEPLDPNEKPRFTEAIDLSRLEQMYL